MDEDLIKKIMDIPGFLNEDEATALYNLAKASTKGVILEIGAYKGKSTIALIWGTRNGKNLPVFSIDPFVEFVDDTGMRPYKYEPVNKIYFVQNLIRYNAINGASIINLYSKEVSIGFKRPISLLYIDGDHTEEGVLMDLDFAKKVIIGGIVAFHDSNRPGPKKGIRYLLSNNDYIITGKVGTLTWLEKRGNHEN